MITPLPQHLSPSVLEEMVGKEGIKLIMGRMKDYIKKNPTEVNMMDAYRMLDDYYKGKYGTEKV